MEDIKEYRKKYYQLNRQQRLEYQRQYNQNNQYKDYQHQYYLRKRKRPNSKTYKKHSNEDYEHILSNIQLTIFFN